MVIPDGHFHHLLLYYFRKGKNAVQARKKLYEYDVYSEKSLTERQCQNWFARFRSGDFYLKDATRPGRPTEVDKQTFYESRIMKLTDRWQKVIDQNDQYIID